MINVDFVKRTVDEMSRSQASSYTSSQDFASEQRLAQDLLMSFYLNRQDQVDFETMAPFIREQLLLNSNGRFQLPEDSRRIVSVEVFETDGANDAFKPAIPIPMGAIASAGRSKLRRSKIGSYYIYRLIGGGIQIDIAAQRIRLRYIQNPPDAVWSSTIDAVNVIETYNPNASTNFQWLEKDLRLLVDCFLYFRGLKVENKELLEFISFKNLNIL